MYIIGMPPATLVVLMIISVESISCSSGLLCFAFFNFSSNFLNSSCRVSYLKILAAMISDGVSGVGIGLGFVESCSFLHFVYTVFPKAS